MILLLGLVALALFIGFVVGVLSLPEDEAVQRHREQRDRGVS